MAARLHHGGRIPRDRMEDAPALKIAVLGHVESGRDRAGFVAIQGSFQLLSCPEIESAFRALTVGIEAGKEATFGRRHFSQHEGQRLLGHPSK